jgi:hypothetical protein
MLLEEGRVLLEEFGDLLGGDQNGGSLLRVLQISISPA